jgi:hypothetical protein
MKFAYELALERLEKRGIERPREETFSGAVREQIAEARRKAEARLTELKIRHQNCLKTIYDPPSARKKRKNTAASAVASRTSGTGRSRSCGGRRRGG